VDIENGLAKGLPVVGGNAGGDVSSLGRTRKTEMDTVDQATRLYFVRNKNSMQKGRKLTTKSKNSKSLYRRTTSLRQAKEVAQCTRKNPGDRARLVRNIGQGKEEGK